MDEPLVVDVNELTMDDLIWLSDWLESGQSGVGGNELRMLRDIIVRCGNWTAAQVGGLRLREMKSTLVAAFQAAKQDESLPFGNAQS
jgi:hypothetical protein